MATPFGFEFDFFVVGGGSGGVRAARWAASLGHKVGLAEKAMMGGTCVNAGCIPKKLYSYAGHYAKSFEDAEGYGWSFPHAPVFDWERLKKNRAREIARLNAVYSSLLDASGVHVLEGHAELLDGHTVFVNGKSYTSRSILIATGGVPFVPDFPGREHVVTSEQIFDLETFPRRLLIVGAGYIACEFASIFNALGSDVTQVHRGTGILAGFDDEVRSFVAKEMREAGVKLRYSVNVQEVVSTSGALHARLDDGTQVIADAILYATGRVPNTAKLGLATAGVVSDARGGIVVDADFRSSNQNVFAVGDVSSGFQLTPVALAEAMVVVDLLFGAGRRRTDQEFLPTAVFTHPCVGTVGLTEQEARRKLPDVAIYRSTFRSLRHTLSGRNTRTLMKLIVNPANDQVVGLHMVGEDAAEIVQGFAVALRAGATKAVFDGTIGIHPTAAEEFVTMREPV